MCTQSRAVFDTLCLTTYGCDFKSVAPAQVRYVSVCTVHLCVSVILDYIHFYWSGRLAGIGVVDCGAVGRRAVS